MSNDLIGYRTWLLKIGSKYLVRETDDGGWERYAAGPPTLRLCSLSTECYWNGPVQHSGRAPSGVNCSGLYALKTLEAAADYSPNPVVGEVAMWGKIVQHAHGWRAEHMLIKRLVLLMCRLPLSDAGSHIKQVAVLGKILETRYQCDVIVDASESWLSPTERFLNRLASGTLTSTELEQLAKELS